MFNNLSKILHKIILLGMYPGDARSYLQGLIQVKEMLIARVCLIMCTYHKYGVQGTWCLKTFKAFSVQCYATSYFRFVIGLAPAAAPINHLNLAWSNKNNRHHPRKSVRVYPQLSKTTTPASSLSITMIPPYFKSVDLMAP